jgi:transcriptional regulator with XRE-family HTH domain
MAQEPSPSPAATGRRRRGRAQGVDLAIGRRLRERRLEQGLTLQQVAELVGVAFQQMHRYEIGVHRLSAGRLHRIARALDVEVGYFFEGVGAEGRGEVGPDETGQRRRLLELVRHAAGIRDPGHRAALCRLARDLAALGTSAPANPPVEQRRPPSSAQSGSIR